MNLKNESMKKLKGNKMKFTMILTFFLSLFHLRCVPPTPTSLAGVRSDFPSLPLPLNKAVEDNDIEKVKVMLALGECSLDGFKGERGDNPLREVNERLYIMSLMEKGMCFNVNFVSPVSWYSSKASLFYVKSLEMLELLLSYGADVNLKDGSGNTPLHVAHNPEIAKFFLDQGLDIEARNDSGWTPLHHAVNYERIAVARFLCKQGADPNAKSNGGWSPWGRANGNSRWHTFSLNRLIKDFKSCPTPKSSTEQNPVMNLELASKNSPDPTATESLETDFEPETN